MRRSLLYVLVLLSWLGVACGAPVEDSAASASTGQGDDLTIQVYRSPT